MKEKIVKALESASFNSLGDYFSFSQIDHKHFSVNVAGIGKLKYPINSDTALQLIEIAKLAPFGLGTETIVDTRVRNVWKIKKEKITIPKATFEKCIIPLLEKVKHDLGLDEDGVLRAELHDFLIYEPGQFFSSHQDTEKEDDMIGTISILLPSEFKGGAFVVEHKNRKKRFSDKQISNKDKISAIAFYADCHHQITKVTAGYRVALTFNLLYQAPKKQLIIKENNKLTQALKEYFNTKLEEQPKWLVFLLEHQYTQKRIGWSTLKGADIYYAKQFLSSAAKLGLAPYLALMEIRESWSAFADDDDYYSRSNRYYQQDDIDHESIEVQDLIDAEHTLTNKDLLQASMRVDRDLTQNILNHIISNTYVYYPSILLELAVTFKKLFDSSLLSLVIERANKEISDLDPDQNGIAIKQKVTCNCKDCKTLTTFLQDPYAKEHLWPLAKDRRAHIHQMIEKMGIGVTHTTIRTGSLHKLQLTKQDSHFVEAREKIDNIRKQLELING